MKKQKKAGLILVLATILQKTHKSLSEKVAYQLAVNSKLNIKSARKVAINAFPPHGDPSVYIKGIKKHLKDNYYYYGEVEKMFREWKKMDKKVKRHQEKASSVIDLNEGERIKKNWWQKLFNGNIGEGK